MSHPDTAAHAFVQKSGLGSASLPLPEFQHPSHALLEDAGFNQIKYTHYRDRCLADRQELGAWVEDPGAHQLPSVQDLAPD